jgi:HD-GYP domain-containing protein (c-di-GMP phosphodiesterase class II)
MRRRSGAQVGATRTAIPPQIRAALGERGLTVTLLDSSALEAMGLAQDDGVPRGEPSRVARLPPLLVLAKADLSHPWERGLELLGRLSGAGHSVIVVGSAPRGTLGRAADAIHAWLPTPVEELSLFTAIRSALSALDLRDERDAARDELEHKVAEVHSVYEIGIALSAERDLHRLQHLILRRCREITLADAGSFYLVDHDAEGKQLLRFEVAQNDSVAASYQQFSVPVTAQSIAGYVALTGRSLNIPDAYVLSPDAPYAHTPGFDERYGYRSKSMLVVPMRNHEGEVTGVVQLINRKRSFATVLSTPSAAEREVVPFPVEAEQVLSSFASQAAVALDNRLLLDRIEQLFEGFVRASVSAIEARDPSTFGHSERVAELTVGIALAVSDARGDRWDAVHFTDEQIREIRYAGLLHDFGKIGVREPVLVKAKKLYDWQLEVIRLRFALVQKALETEHLRRQLHLALEQGPRAFEAALRAMDAEHEQHARQLDDDLVAVLQANEPTVLEGARAQRLLDLAEARYVDAQGRERPLLEPTEILALSIRRGSLTEEERREIESHVSHTYRFLSLMPWTRPLRNVAAIAGAHHEKLDGSGYPQGLRGEQIPLQSRMMTVADIYDALTAADRPYKRAVSVQQALDILGDEARAGHIDGDLLEVFAQRRIFERTGMRAEG